jgi:hypothetical protein|tara:strand:+ start:1073 stop:1279 length:207 start_codon:yes stop_codon:yes gene_type:complete
LPSKNPYTDAILSIADEYKNLIKTSKKKGNRVPKTMHDRPKDSVLFPKLMASQKRAGITKPKRRNIVG